MSAVRLQGFRVPVVALPDAPVDDATLERLALVLAAMVAGHTPEEVARHLDAGFPERVWLALERPCERSEMDAFAGLLLSVAEG